MGVVHTPLRSEAWKVDFAILKRDEMGLGAFYINSIMDKKQRIPRDCMDSSESEEVKGPTLRGYPLQPRPNKLWVMEKKYRWEGIMDLG
jgi:hypothetical protein